MFPSQRSSIEIDLVLYCQWKPSFLISSKDSIKRREQFYRVLYMKGPGGMNGCIVARIMALYKQNKNKKK